MLNWEAPWGLKREVLQIKCFWLDCSATFSDGGTVISVISQGKGLPNVAHKTAATKSAKCARDCQCAQKLSINCEIDTASARKDIWQSAP